MDLVNEKAIGAQEEDKTMMTAEETETYTCETCSTTYPSWANYSRNDACYKAQRDARWARELARHGETPFGDEGEVTATDTRSAYSKNTAAAIAAADAPTRNGGPGSGTGTAATGATQKQRDYIAVLAAERGREVEARWLASKAAASAAIDTLLGLPRVSAPAAAPQARPATEKQVDFLRKLVDERDFYSLSESDRRKVTWFRNGGHPTAAGASALIDVLLNTAFAADATDDSTSLQKGDIHVVDGQYVRVHASQRNDSLYACVATVIQEAVWADGKVVTPGQVEWEYKAGLIKKLNDGNKATAEQAKQFATLAGRCIFCSRAIDTPESTAVGYGPVCAAKFDLPWGDTTETVDKTDL